MKKNKTMRLAACLLVLTLLTTSVISGTFAKYVTKASGSDSARVAQWGFQTATVSLNDLFKNAYDTTVSSEVDVIAPGTTNSGTFGFTYDSTTDVTAPEVAYTFTVSTDGSTIADDIKSNANIQWKLDNNAWGTWDKMISDIKALSGDPSGTKQYAAGVLPTEFSDATSTHTVYWQWVFNTSDTADGIDTTMGNKTTLDSVKLQVSITATQVD